MPQVVKVDGGQPSRRHGGEPALSAETEAIRWAAESEVAELASEAYAIRVLDALRASSPAAIRQHDGVQLL